MSFLRVWPLFLLVFGVFADDTVYRVGGDVAAPGIIERVAPEYSARARDSKVEGKVAVSLVITEQGRATNMKITRPLHADLDANAMKALEQWRFEPATKAGQPVKVQATIEVEFRLANYSLPK